MYLSPLDYCTEENAEVAKVLKSFGALIGEAVVEQRKAAAATMEPEPTAEEKEQKDGGTYMCLESIINPRCRVTVVVLSVCSHASSYISSLYGSSEVS